MANPVQHAQNTLERVHARVQPYMATLFYKLAINYLILLALVMIANIIGIPLLLRVVPLSLATANVLSFSITLLILVFGWRFLENRNHATALFVLYARYSRQKRDLEATLTMAEQGVLEDDNRLYVHVDLLEEIGTAFLQAVEEQGLKAHRS